MAKRKEHPEEDDYDGFQSPPPVKRLRTANREIAEFFLSPGEVPLFSSGLTPTQRDRVTPSPVRPTQALNPAILSIRNDEPQPLAMSAPLPESKGSMGSIPLTQPSNPRVKRKLDFGDIPMVVNPLSETEKKKSLSLLEQELADFDFETEQELSDRLRKSLEVMMLKPWRCMFCGDIYRTSPYASPLKKAPPGMLTEPGDDILDHIKSPQCRGYASYFENATKLFGTDVFCHECRHLSFQKYWLQSRRHMLDGVPDCFEPLFGDCTCKLQGIGKQVELHDGINVPYYCQECGVLSNTKYKIRVMTCDKTRQDRHNERAFRDCHCETNIKRLQQLEEQELKNGFIEYFCPLHKAFNGEWWKRDTPVPLWLDQLTCGCPSDFKNYWCTRCLHFDIKGVTLVQGVGEQDGQVVINPSVVPLSLDHVAPSWWRKMIGSCGDHTPYLTLL